MNELTETRALRDTCPPPEAHRLAPQRARVLEAVRNTRTGPRQIPGRPAPSRGLPRRRIVLSTAAAAVLAVTGGVITNLPRSTTEGPRTLSARASAEALELAAATVERNGATEPGPKQWVYEKSTAFNQGTPQTSEQWTRWDGTGYAHLPGRAHVLGIAPGGDIKNSDPNKLQVWYGPNQEAKWKKQGYDDRSQRQFYRFLATLPSDPDRMLRRIREEHAIGDVKGETKAERDWRELGVLLRSVLIPPKVQAGMFRVLANIPGARVEKGIKDPLGRKAIAVTVNYPKPTAAGWQGKQEIFFDPETYSYLAEKQHGAPPTPPTKITENATDGKPTPTTGTMDSGIVTARAAWGVVNTPGTRP